MAGTAMSRHTAASVSTIFMADFIADEDLHRRFTGRSHVVDASQLHAMTCSLWLQARWQKV